METVSVILLVVVIGLIVAFLLRSRTEGGRAPELEREQERLVDEVAELKRQLGDAQQELRTLREEAATLRADSSNQAKRIEELAGERDQARSNLETAQANLGQTRERLAEVEAAHETREQELEQRRTELETRFQEIAANVTESTREQFIKEFRDLTKQQSEASAELVGNTVKPLHESLQKLDQGNQEMEKARENAYADLRRTLLSSNEAIATLSGATGDLREALRSPQVRGLWGEQQLQNVIEAAGLREHVDYGSQETHGTARPDVIVRIPGDRSVVIDAKTPFDSYLNALAAEDDASERSLLNQHAASLYQHAGDLGKKDYSQRVGDALDFVILFVPSDAILDAALKVRPALWEDSWRQHRVLLATPGSLIAFLRAVALVWQQQKVQENAQEIADAARELYDRLGVYSGHVLKLGNQLSTVVNTYNQSVGSFQSRVLPQARRIEDLSEIEQSRRIEEPEPIVTEPRELRAPEVREFPDRVETAD